MQPKILRLTMLAAAMATGAASVAASVADSWPVPEPESAPTAQRGATMPYTRYECNTPSEATLAGGATILTSPDWDATNKASQAGGQAYVSLPTGASVAWTMKTEGDGLTIRYTIADKNVGGTGKTDGWKSSEGQLKIYVNGVEDCTVDLTSYYMYQYFSKGSGSPAQSGGTAPCFCFDEKHVRLSKVLKSGDVIRVECVSGSEVGVDFIETELVPEAIDPAEDAGGRRIFDVTAYGASTSSADNVPAFNKAIAAARSAGGGIVYIPEGTWRLGQMWSLAGKNIKITGAGIWYTNLQFTSYKSFGGGISGGNPSNGPFKSNECDNMEVCHMYINSNLADRYGENAVYKCFMDIWCGGSVIHDIWEEHFECGFWFGDYNSSQRRTSDRVVVANSRLRNNYADGVNFCQGTSNAAVFNCNVRNCGDDGLACWNNTDNVKDETNNTFAYNTIDFIWRAGGIAIYGAQGHKVYNNYICDMFMASGIHLNSTFPGPKFATANAQNPHWIANNWLVRCGTPWECWGRDYAAIDIEGEVKHVHFINNYVYESPAEIVRVVSKSLDGIKFDGLYCNGAGLSKQSVDYSASNHSLGAGNFNYDPSQVSFKDFYITRGSVPAATVGANMDQYKTWPFWNQAPTTWAWTDEEYVTPAYPDASYTPYVNPFETLTNYDLVLTGIDWLTQKNVHNMYDGDNVTFRVRVDNKGRNSIPEDAKFGVTLTVDGGAKYTATVRGGLAAGAHTIVEFSGDWRATAGTHSFTAVADPAGKCLYEDTRDNNTRTKTVNVYPVEEGEFVLPPTHAGIDMAVVKVWFKNLDGNDDEVRVGDRLEPHAIVANLGSSSISLGAGKGVLWALDGTPEYNTGMLWDDASHTVAPGKYIDVTPCGGGSAGQTLAQLGWIKNGDTYYVKAPAGELNLVCRLDNPDTYRDGTADNNQLSEIFTYPVAKPEYIANPDRADNLTTLGLIDYEEGGPVVPDDPMQGITGYNFSLFGLRWDLSGDQTVGIGRVAENAPAPDTEVAELNEGDQVIFSVRVDNTSAVAIPAGVTLRTRVRLSDGTVILMPDITDGLPANSYVILTAETPWQAVAGAHTATAEVDFDRAFRGETTRDDNSRAKAFNVAGEAIRPEDPELPWTTVTGGSDLRVIDILWQRDGVDATPGHGPIAAGDDIIWTAKVVNAGDAATTFGGNEVKCGVQFQIDGNTSGITWCDEYKRALAAGEEVLMTANGGNGGNRNRWKATGSNFSITAWINDTHNVVNEVASGSSDDDNKLTRNYALPYAGLIATEPDRHETPDYPDILLSGTSGVSDVLQGNADEADVWYNLQGIRLQGRPTATGVYIHNGTKVLVK